MRNKIICTGEKNTYIQTDTSTRKFEAVVAGSEFFGTERCGQIDAVSFQWNEDEKADTYTLSITFTMPQTESAVKAAQSAFSKILAGLNKESNLTTVYLNKVDFFNRQFIEFSRKVGTDLVKAPTQHNHNQHATPSGNLAF
jgi:hypothetical protein